jgi:hypothetical protein
MHFEKSGTLIGAFLNYRLHMREIGAGGFGTLHGHIGVEHAVPELESILMPPFTKRSVHIANSRVDRAP